MIVTLKHTGKSWWWEQHQCEIECSDGRKVDPREHISINEGMAWEVHETPEGIEGRYFHCSSGQGKRLSWKKLLIPRDEYHQVIHTGTEPERPPQDIFDFVMKETGW